MPWGNAALSVNLGSLGNFKPGCMCQAGRLTSPFEACLVCTGRTGRQVSCLCHNSALECRTQLAAHQPQNFQAWMVQGASMTRGTASLVYLRAAVRPTLMIQADAKPPSMLTTSGIRHTMQHDDVCDDGMHAALSQRSHCIMHCHLRHMGRQVPFVEFQAHRPCAWIRKMHRCVFLQHSLPARALGSSSNKGSLARRCSTSCCPLEQHADGRPPAHIELFRLPGTT